MSYELRVGGRRSRVYGMVERILIGGPVAAKAAWALTLAMAVCLGLAGCAKEPPLNGAGEPVELRLGYFPNVTHAQAMLGVSRGDFQRAVGPDVKLAGQTFNAGPALIEAVYAGHIDIGYVGPSPVLNGFVQSKGEEVRVIAGSATNGVLIIGNKARNITRLEQLKGGRVATPQFANTQDISARYFLKERLGVKFKSDGGETDIIPMANPDIETLFAKDQIDGAWVPEPWGSRILNRGLANLIMEEKELWPGQEFPITCVIARRAFVDNHPELVERFLRAHVALTRELQADAVRFGPELNAELERLTMKKLPEAVVDGALRYTGFSYEISGEAFELQFKMAKSLGLLRADKLDTDMLMALGPLERAVNDLKSDKDSETTLTQEGRVN